MALTSTNLDTLLDGIKYDRDDLVIAIVLDDATGEPIMCAYMNRESLRQTLETGKMTYWSRSRSEFWVKGETSGHTQAVKEVRVDCDQDALLFRVEQVGGACHTGHYSCFYRKLGDDGWIDDGKMAFDPDEVYQK